MRVQIPLTAGASLRQFFRGRCLAVVSTGAASSVRVALFGRDQQDAEDFGEVGKNFSIFADVQFSGVELTATVNTTVELIVTDYRVDLLDGSGVTLQSLASGLVLPVQDRQATVVGNGTQATVGDTEAALSVADATRVELRVTNTGANPCALGAPGITWANRAIVLNPGDTWIETRASARAWHAICATGLATTVGRQYLTAP